jgi:hypothetical protein
MTLDKSWSLVSCVFTSDIWGLNRLDPLDPNQKMVIRYRHFHFLSPFPIPPLQTFAKDAICPGVSASVSAASF